MRFHAPALIASAALVALATPPSSARAQTDGDITITLSRVEQSGTTLRDGADDDLTRPYNETECADAANVTSTFALTNLPSGVTFVDVWLGNTTQDCSTEDARQSGANRQCVHLTANPDIDGTDSTFTISLAEMFTSTETVADPCSASAATGEMFNLWVFATNATETTGAVTVDQYGFYQIEVDSSAPAAPAQSGDSDRTGDTSIPVSWDAGSEANLFYNVYVDNSISTCSDAGLYTPGAAVPSGVVPHQSSVTGTSSNISTNASDVNLAEGESALVYITALDDADNESVVSDAYCITRVPTAGFCELYEARSGEACPQDCSVRPGAARRDLPPAALAFLLIGAAALLRRTSR